MAEHEMGRWSRRPESSSPALSLVKSSETSYDVALDDPDDSPRGTVYVDVVAAGKTHDRPPIIPAQWRGPANVKATLRYHAELAGYRVGYHAARLPFEYLPKGVFWGTWGALRLQGRIIAWWWHADGAYTLQQAAASRNDREANSEWHKAATVVNARRKFRFAVVAGQIIATVSGVLYVVYAAPWWLQLVAPLAAVPVLAHFARPADRPIISAAVVTPRLRRVNADIVLRAYYVAGLGRPDKDDQKVGFGSVMSRDARNTGSQVIIDLPHGRSFSEVINAKDKLASGLDVSSNQVFITKAKDSERRHTLFVADRDPLAMPAGKTDLLDCKPRSIWQPIRFGMDERDQLVTVLLLWTSVLIGAQPRKGKTFSARLLALHAALDPFVKLLIADGKNSPDWDKFRLVAHRMVFGTHPNPRDTDPVTHLEEMLDEVLAHIEKVNEVLSTLPVNVCPEGKLTEELARDPRFPDLRIWLLVMEEFQMYFETEDQKTNIRIANKLSKIQAVGPSGGVILLSSSQKPSGVGAGDVGRLFNRYRDNHGARFALKCGNRDVSMAVLGGDAYSEGYDASALPVGKEYLGVGYLYGITDETPTVRTFLADHGDAERILTAARAHREALGLLSGAAAGEEASRIALDLPADVLRVFSTLGRDSVSWRLLAELLASQMPEKYGALTQAALSSLMVKAGVPTENVVEEGGRPKGCKRAKVEAAIERRQLTSR